MIDFDGGFNEFFAAAYQLNETIAQKFGTAFGALQSIMVADASPQYCKYL